VVIFEPGTTSEEKALASARSGNTITLAQRALEGSAVSHTASSVIRHGLSAVDVNEANYAVSQTVGLVAAKGDLLYGSAANTLARLAKGTANQSPMWDSTGALTAGNPAPAAHTHAESDVTDLVGDLGSLQDAPLSGWAQGSLLVGKSDGSADTLALGTAGSVPTSVGGNIVWQTPTQGLLAHIDYTSTSSGLSASALTVVDSTNLSPSFTVPASGKVLIRVSGQAVVNHSASTITTVSFGWKNHTGGAQIGRTQTIDLFQLSSTPVNPRYSIAQTLTGLTSGDTLRLDLAAETSSIIVTLTDVTIEVWAA
jgi:hypothetical protein